MMWAAKYVGLPFVDFGRDFTGVDCWGLVRLVLMEEAHIDVPTYGEISAHDLIKVTQTISSESSIDPWRPVQRNELQAFDLALMRGRPMHVGIMADAKHLLHVEEKICAVFLPLTHPSVSGRLLRFIRHRDAH